MVANRPQQRGATGWFILGLLLLSFGALLGLFALAAFWAAEASRGFVWGALVGIGLGWPLMRWARAGDPRVRVDEPSRREALITLVDFTALGPVLFVWRALTQWLGGIGIIVLFVGLYPYLAIACLGNIGPGLGAVGPMESFAWLHPGAKGVLIFLMLAGRLEVVSLFALASRDAWRPARQRA